VGLGFQKSVDYIRQEEVAAEKRRLDLKALPVETGSIAGGVRGGGRLELKAPPLSSGGIAGAFASRAARLSHSYECAELDSALRHARLNTSSKTDLPPTLGYSDATRIKKIN
jgi:hypothetical protein